MKLLGDINNGWNQKPNYHFHKRRKTNSQMLHKGTVIVSKVCNLSLSSQWKRQSFTNLEVIPQKLTLNESDMNNCSVRSGCNPIETNIYTNFFWVRSNERLKQKYPCPSIVQTIISSAIRKEVCHPALILKIFSFIYKTNPTWVLLWFLIMNEDIVVVCSLSCVDRGNRFRFFGGNIIRVVDRISQADWSKSKI